MLFLPQKPKKTSKNSKKQFFLENQKLEPSPRSRSHGEKKVSSKEAV
jgi:hypothetical protein